MPVSVIHMKSTDSPNRRHDAASARPDVNEDGTSAAFGAYCRRRWPFGSGKAAAREWDLTRDEALSLAGGRGSKATMDKVWQHPRGGWPVIVEIMAAVTGVTLRAWIEGEGAAHAKPRAPERATFVNGRGWV